jgi:hypothetical protein
VKAPLEFRPLVGWRAATPVVPAAIGVFAAPGGFAAVCAAIVCAAVGAALTWSQRLVVVDGMLAGRWALGVRGQVDLSRLVSVEVPRMSLRRRVVVLDEDDRVASFSVVWWGRAPLAVVAVELDYGRDEGDRWAVPVDGRTHAALTDALDMAVRRRLFA